MADRGSLLLGAAGVLVLASTLVLSSDGIVAGVVNAVLEATGTDYALAAALGGAGVLAAALTALGARGTALNQASMPDAERPVGVPPPGASFDDRLGGWRSWLPVVGRARRQEIRDRLRDAAIDVVAADRGVTPERARKVVARGEWTTDDRVAAFLAEEGGGGAASTGALLTGRSRTERVARRAVDEIEAVATGRIDADDGDAGGPDADAGDYGRDYDASDSGGGNGTSDADGEYHPSDAGGEYDRNDAGEDSHAGVPGGDYGTSVPDGGTPSTDAGDDAPHGVSDE